METLYTGFKGAGNSSYILVSQIDGEKMFLTNSFAGLSKQIESISKDYGRVYIFGLDKMLKDSIRIEACAQKDGSILYSSVDLNNMANRLMMNGIKCMISKNPTWYLCNEAYYFMLKKYNHNAILIHVPSARYITQEFANAIISALDENVTS